MPADKIKNTTSNTLSVSDAVHVIGARENNLKNISVDIPHDKLTVITGLSGSGKSSLAFDTIYAEGQRRYIETFSSYARNMLGSLERPDADSAPSLPSSRRQSTAIREAPSARQLRSTTSCDCSSPVSDVREAISAVRRW